MAAPALFTEHCVFGPQGEGMQGSTAISSIESIMVHSGPFVSTLKKKQMSKVLALRLDCLLVG